MANPLRAIDFIKVVSSDDINEGLDAYKASPQVAIRGPYLKSKFRKGATDEPVKVRWSSAYLYFEPFNEMSHERESKSQSMTEVFFWSGGPVTRFLPMSRAEVIRYYLTPKDHRRPTIDSLEKAESRAFAKWQREKTRLFHDWERKCACIESACLLRYAKQIERRQKRVLVLQERIKKLDFRIQKLNVLRQGKPKKYRAAIERLTTRRKSLRRELSQLPRPMLEDPVYPPKPTKGTYVARMCDIWLHQSAGAPTRFGLDRVKSGPTDLPCDHTTYIRPNSGYISVSGSYVGGRQYTTGEIADGYREEFSYRVPMPPRSITMLDFGPISYDQDAVRQGLIKLMRSPKSQFSSIVSLVELSELPALLGQLRKFLDDIALACVNEGDRVVRNFRTIKNLARKGAKISSYPKNLHLVKAGGVIEAGKWVGSQDLMNKFGLSDLSYFTEVRDALVTKLDAILKPLRDAIRHTKRPTSFHIRCGEAIENDDRVMSLDDLLVASLSQVDPDWAVPDHSDSPYDRRSNPLGRLADLSGAKVRWRITRKIKKVLCVRMITRLEDPFGRSVEGDEAIARFLLDVLGFNLDPKYIWDLTHLSFLVDWVYNIGDLLSDIGRIPNLSIRRSIVGAVLKEEILETHVPTIEFDLDHDSGRDEMDPPDPEMFRGYEWSINGRIVGGSYTLKRFRRRIVSGSELESLLGVRFSEYFRTATAWQFITAAELLAQAAL